MIQETVRLYLGNSNLAKVFVDRRSHLVRNLRRAMLNQSEEIHMTSGIMAFLHHLAAFTLVGSLIYEHTAFRKDLSLIDARRIQRMDILFGLSAGFVLVVGLLRVFYFEKVSVYYAQIWFFWTKMAGFAFAALLSIYPTVRFVSWRKFFARNQTPEISA